MQLQEFLDKLSGVKKDGPGWKAVCPAHDDHEPSLGIRDAGDRILVTCRSRSCAVESIVQAVGLTMADLWYDNRPKSGFQGEPEATYNYTDECGNLLFQALRYPGKKFSQRHFDAEEGKWVSNLEGVPRVLYNLPQVLATAAAGGVIYLCEGEKDAESIIKLGVTASCNPMGAGKWREEYNKSLIGATVVVIQDKDEPGRHHAERVRDSLRTAGIEVFVQEARTGKDATDHLEAGHTLGELVAVIERVRRGIVTAKEMANAARVHRQLEEDASDEMIVAGFTVGRRSLAFRPSRVYLLGGYTSDGKTTLELQVARSLLERPVPPRIGIFSLEMSSDDLRNRFIEHWGLSLHKIEHPWLLNDQEKGVFDTACGQMATWPLEIIFNSEINAEQICEITRDREYDFIFIDHIHRFQWGEERRALEKQVVMLTNLSLDFNIPIFVLAQFRNYSTGKGMQVYPRPSLQDFKETGALGQEAAMAMAIYRARDNVGNFAPNGGAEFIVLKNRYGPTSSQHLELDTQRMMFVPPGQKLLTQEEDSEA